jgi:hypothetical protein
LKEPIEFHLHQFEKKLDEKNIIEMMMEEEILIERDFLVQFELMLMNEDRINH